jgi:DUF4097 and DUF4098 domain-containing protein YvlB
LTRAERLKGAIDMEQTFATREPILVTVEIPAGRIEIEGTETDETRVGIERVGRDIDPEKIELDLREEGGRQHLVVRAKHTKFSSGRYRVSITTHAGADLHIETASADVRLRGAFGDADVHSASGDIEAEEVRGNARMRSASGNLAVVEVRGELEFNSASGRLRAGRIGGRADLHSVSGSVTVGEAAAAVDVKTVSGDIRLGSIASGDVLLHSVSGDIEVGIGAGAKAFIDAHSMSGRMRSDLEVSDAPGTPGEPNVDIRANTMSGDVTIRRSNRTAA